MDSVLIVIGYTDIKFWCRPLVPGIFANLTYPNKELLFLTDSNYPGLSKKDSGEMVAASIRQEGINYARKKGHDYIFFCDVDTIPDADIIEKLLKPQRPLIGGAHAARGNADLLIGHNYVPKASLNRVQLSCMPDGQVLPVGCTSGGLLLVHKSIFSEVDYTGYNGPDTIPGRFTADDEYFQLKIKEKTGVTPYLHLGTGGWHLNNDNKAYRWPGLVEKYNQVADTIYFKGKAFKYG